MKITLLMFVLSLFVFSVGCGGAPSGQVGDENDPVNQPEPEMDAAYENKMNNTN
ncbi:hypothetical protein EC9_27190 [Rosistilla ulvae]|uniref:Secreted protein n=1 Tax=Rosistilla ulvae TaxID=1930277 RepID=A0A517M0W9_9BACT|nr:hypothetical protein [Rosistilla ulvae]QDS88528.1 hypothetical protein EC9_27190 [Rosistilla ulvae]